MHEILSNDDIAVILYSDGSCATAKSPDKLLVDACVDAKTEKIVWADVVSHQDSHYLVFIQKQKVCFGASGFRARCQLIVMRWMLALLLITNTGEVCASGQSCRWRMGILVWSLATLLI